MPLKCTFSDSLQGFNLLHLSLPEWFLLLYFGFLCLQISSVCNLCPDTGVKGGHLFRLTCSVVLWGGRDIANKYCWHVWGVLTVGGPHWVCHSPRQHVLPRFTLLRFPGCSARALPQVGPVSHAVSRTKPLRFLGVL